jgi:hypothetical protein
LALIAVCGFAQMTMGQAATTTVADTVYMADGSSAQGSLIITWPAFVTSSGTAVAAGMVTTTLGADGALNVALVPNTGASPAGVYYSVTYQLGPGQVKTESWVVPTTSPAKLATVRATPGSGVAAQPVSMQYVDSALATKADDNSVVHLGGSETINGAKTFAMAPNVPAPTSATQVASKAYVDTALSNVGAGNFLPTAGGTMTGPLTLAAAPAAALQASTKQYVDMGLSAKADVIAGLVPANELGSGTAGAGSCLVGNGGAASWGACGSGSGTGDLSSSPTSDQSISQPGGTQFSTNNWANIRYVTAGWNWSQRPSDNLATPGSATIHLSPCPLGVDATANTSYTYKVYISGTGTAEAVAVTGGTCTPGAGSGTIVVTTANAHAAGYTVGSASAGIQEAWNDAWVNDTAAGVSGQTAPYVKLISNTTYNVYATLYLRGRGGVFDGAGSYISCSTRDRCIYIGVTKASPYVHHHKVYNVSGGSTVTVDGVQVSNASATSGTYTITTASNHPFVVGDTVDCEINSQTIAAHMVVRVASVPNATSFTYQLRNDNIAAGANTYGWCALLNAFIENNSDHVALQDVNIFRSANPLAMGQFTYGIVNDNDQQFIIERAADRGTGVIMSTANFPMGAFLYERTDQGMAGITYLHNSEFTGDNCVTAGGNGLVISDTVCQGFPVFGVRYFGGYQPGTFTNIYQESTGGSANPLYGYAAQAGYVLSGIANFTGNFPMNGYSPTFQSSAEGTATTVRNYFIVANSSTGSGPIYYAGQSNQSNSGGANITVKWPSPQLSGANNVTFDVLVTTGSAAPPYGTGNFAVAKGIPWSTACTTSGMCSFVDTQGALSSYTVQSNFQWTPTFWWWPSNLVLNSANVFVPQIWANHSIVSNTGTKSVSVIADRCTSAGNFAQYTPVWVECLATDPASGSGFIGTVMQQTDLAGNGPPVNSKGRLNLGKAIAGPNDLITLADSNFAKTTATAGERPSNDAGDTAIGTDQNGGLSQRAATSISEYINAVPNGTNFQERLTGTGKTFNVPVTVNGNLTVASPGTVTLPVTGTGSQCLHVSSTGVVSGTGSDCGSGGGDPPSGTVNSGTASQVAMYSGSGTAVSGDAVLTDNGTTLNYTGSGGIAAATGNFSGNLTVGGQLIVTGPWAVSTPVPGTAMVASASGTSSLGISNDGNFYLSANAGAPSRLLTSATDAVPSVFGRTGAVMATGGDYSCTQVTGCTPNSTTVNGHALTGNVTVSASDLAAGALANGMTATTQTVGDNSTKVATTGYVDGNYVSPVLDWGFSWSTSNTVPFNTTTGHMNVFGIYVDRPVRCSSITVYVVAADTSTTNTYDIGLYYGVSGSANALIAHTGAVVANTYFGTALTFTTIPFGSTVTLMPGRYYVGLYANEASAPLTLASNNSGNIEFYHYNAATITPASGGLPGSFTGPVDAFTVSYAPKFLLK